MKSQAETGIVPLGLPETRPDIWILDLLFENCDKRLVSLVPSHFVNLSFCQPVIFSTCHFVNLSFCQPVILSTCHFVNLSFCQTVIFINWSVFELVGL
jgi:hypothetical protein